MKEFIKELRERETKLNEELSKINKAINSLQDVCTHTLEDTETAYEYEGHDSHYDYEKCSICGVTRKA